MSIDTTDKSSSLLRALRWAAAGAAVAYVGYWVHKTYVASSTQQNDSSSQQLSAEEEGNQITTLYGFDIAGLLTPVQPSLASINKNNHNKSSSSNKPEKGRNQIHVLVRTSSSQVASVIRSQFASALQPLQIKPENIFLEIIIEPLVTASASSAAVATAASSSSRNDDDATAMQRTHLSTTDDLFAKDLTLWFVHGFRVCSVRSLEHRMNAVPEVVLREVLFRVERLRGGSTQDRVVVAAPPTSGSASSSPLQQRLVSMSPPEQPQRPPPLKNQPSAESSSISSQSSAALPKANNIDNNSHNVSSENMDAIGGGGGGVRRGSSSLTTLAGNAAAGNFDQNSKSSSLVFDSAHLVSANSMNNSMTEDPTAQHQHHHHHLVHHAQHQHQQQKQLPRLRPRNINFGDNNEDDDDDDEDDDDTAAGNESGQCSTATPPASNSNSGSTSGRVTKNSSTINFDIHRANTPQIPRSRSATTADTSAQISAAATPIMSFAATPPRSGFPRSSNSHLGISPKTLPASVGGVNSGGGVLDSSSSGGGGGGMPTFPVTTSTEHMALFGGHISPHATPGNQYFLPPQQLPSLSKTSSGSNLDRSFNNTGNLPPRAPSSGKGNNSKSSSGRGTPAFPSHPHHHHQQQQQQQCVEGSSSGGGEGGGGVVLVDEAASSTSLVVGGMISPPLGPAPVANNNKNSNNDNNNSSSALTRTESGLSSTVRPHFVLPAALNTDSFVDDHNNSNPLLSSSLIMTLSCPTTPLIVLSVPTAGLLLPAASAQHSSRRIARLTQQRESKLVTVAFRALTEVKHQYQQQQATPSPNSNINSTQTPPLQMTDSLANLDGGGGGGEDLQLDITGDAALKSIPSDIVLFDASRNISDNPLGIDARSRDGKHVVLPSVLISGLIFLLDAQHSISDGIVSSLSVTQVVAQRIAAEHNEDWPFIERALQQINNDPTLADVRIRNLAELQFALEAHIDIFAGLAVSDPDELYTLVDHDDDRVLLPLMGCSFGAFCLVSALFHKLVEVYGPLNDESFRKALKACNPDIRESACSRLFRGLNRRRAGTISLFDFVHFVSRQVARTTGHVTSAITARAMLERERNRTPSPMLSSSGGDTAVPAAGTQQSSPAPSLGGSFAGVSLTSLGLKTPLGQRSRANSSMMMPLNANESTTTLPFAYQGGRRTSTGNPLFEMVQSSSSQQQQQQQQNHQTTTPPPPPSPPQHQPGGDQQQQQQLDYFYNASFGLPAAHVPLDVLLHSLQRCGDKTVVEALARTGLLKALFHKHEDEWKRRNFWFESLVDEDNWL